jgi:hypothetical protein
LTATQRDNAARIISLLEGVAGGSLDARVALEHWPDIDLEADSLLAASWHDLSHYAADKDIRDRDPAYATYQNNLLLIRAKTIKERTSSGR